MSLNIADTLSGSLRLMFKWNPIFFDCISIGYIITFDCGYCPDTTTDTEVVCTDIITGSSCTFTIQTEICNSLTGNVTMVPLNLRSKETPKNYRLYT